MVRTRSGIEVTAEMSGPEQNLQNAIAEREVGNSEVREVEETETRPHPPAGAPNDGRNEENNRFEMSGASRRNENQSAKLPIYKRKLQPVSTNFEEQPSDISRLIRKVRSMQGNYSEESLIEAFEAALPSHLTKQFNPAADKTIDQLLSDVNEAFNSGSLITQENRRLMRRKYIPSKDLASQISEFVAEVEDFNSRVEEMSDGSLDLKWSMNRILDFVSENIIPAKKVDYRAEFMRARKNLLREKPYREWKTHDLRRILGDVGEVERIQENTSSEAAEEEGELHTIKRKLALVEDTVKAREQPGGRFFRKQCFKCNKWKEGTGRFFCDCGENPTCALCNGRHLTERHDDAMKMLQRFRNGNGSRQEQSQQKEKLNELKDLTRQIQTMTKMMQTFFEKSADAGSSRPSGVNSIEKRDFQ